MFPNGAILDNMTSQLYFSKVLIWHQRSGEFALRVYISEVGTRELTIKGYHMLRMLAYVVEMI